MYMTAVLKMIAPLMQIMFTDKKLQSLFAIQKSNKSHLKQLNVTNMSGFFKFSPKFHF